MSNNTKSSQDGLTIVELLITISIGSMVIVMLMGILSSTLFTKNIVEHENRLKSEAYYVSEFLQETFFDLGVRSIESIYIYDEETRQHEYFIIRHEYDIVRSENSGIIRRDYSHREAFVLHHDHETMNLYYGPYDSFSESDDNIGFNDPSQYRINDSQINIEPHDEYTLSYRGVLEGGFRNEDWDPDDDDSTREIRRTAGAIIDLRFQLSFGERDNPVFKPQSFHSTIVF